MTVKELIAELSKLSAEDQDLNAAVAMFDFERGTWKFEETTEVDLARARGQVIIRGK